MLKDVLPSKVKLYSMSVPRFRNHIVVCGTSAGLIMLDVTDENDVSARRLTNCCCIISFASADYQIHVLLYRIKQVHVMQLLVIRVEFYLLRAMHSLLPLLIHLA